MAHAKDLQAAASVFVWLAGSKRGARRGVDHIFIAFPAATCAHHLLSTFVEPAGVRRSAMHLAHAKDIVDLSCFLWGGCPA
jgi:hypothetical protein